MLNGYKRTNFWHWYMSQQPFSRHVEKTSYREMICFADYFSTNFPYIVILFINKGQMSVLVIE